MSDSSEEEEPSGVDHSPPPPPPALPSSTAAASKAKPKVTREPSGEDSGEMSSSGLRTPPPPPPPSKAKSVPAGMAAAAARKQPLPQNLRMEDPPAKKAAPPEAAMPPDNSLAQPLRKASKPQMSAFLPVPAKVDAQLRTANDPPPPPPLPPVRLSTEPPPSSAPLKRLSFRGALFGGSAATALAQPRSANDPPPPPRRSTSEPATSVVPPKRSSLRGSLFGDSAAASLPEVAAQPRTSDDPPPPPSKPVKRNSFREAIFGSSAVPLAGAVAAALPVAEARKHDDPPPPPRKQLWHAASLRTADDPSPPPRPPTADFASSTSQNGRPDSLDEELEFGNTEVGELGRSESQRSSSSFEKPGRANSPRTSQRRSPSLMLPATGSEQLALETRSGNIRRASSAEVERPSMMRKVTQMDNASMDMPEAKLTMEQRRGKIVIEVYDTEISYKSLLKEFREVLLAQLEVSKQTIAHDFLNRPKLAGLFANLEQIEHLSDQLISEMETEFALQGLICNPDSKDTKSSKLSAKELFKSAREIKAASLVRVGIIFESIAKLLALYCQYVDNHAYATDDIEEFAEDSKFKDTWSRILSMQPKEKEKVSSTSTFQGYLILPIQRVPRYVLLLKELASCTEKILAQDQADGSHKELYTAELKAVGKALSECTLAAGSMNETIRKSQAHQLMVSLQRSLVKCKIDLLSDAPTQQPRTIVKQGELVRVTQSSHKHKKFHFHLLTDMIMYSVPLRSDQFAFHRCFSLLGAGPGQQITVNDDLYFGRAGGLDHAKDYDKYMAYEAGGDKRKSTSSRISGRWLAGDSNSGETIKATRAFKIRFPGKDITLYASTEEEKSMWVEAIREQIKLLKTMGSSRQSIVSVFNKDDIERAKECQMCKTPISSSLWSSKQNVCTRCGLQVCKACSGRRRVLIKGETAVPCCDVCRIEMDLTPRDFDPDRFRITLTIESVDGPLQSLAKSREDRAQPFDNLYFNLTHYSQGKSPLRRGNSSLGHQATFQVAVGPVPGSTDHDIWMLRLFMQRSGEVGNVCIDFGAVMCDSEMVRRRQCERVFSLRALQAPTGVRSEGEGVVNISVRVRMKLETPPNLYISPRDFAKEQVRKDKDHSNDLGKRDGGSGANPRPPSASVSEPGDVGGGGANDEEDDAQRRLRLFQTPPLRAGTIINKSLLILYETSFLLSPSYLKVVCVDYLMGDCIRRIAQLALANDPRKATLLNRLRLFHHHPLVLDCVSKEQQEGGGDVVAVPELLDISNGLPSRHPRLSPRTLQGNSLASRSNNGGGAVYESPAAKNFFSGGAAQVSPTTPPLLNSGLPSGGEINQPMSPMTNGHGNGNGGTGKDLTEVYNRRQLVLEELLKSEEEYVRRLNLLSDVFVTPLMHVANGASVATVLKDADGDEEVRLNAKDRYQTRVVAEFVRERYVTVLLQSVRQILTVNEQLYHDLKNVIHPRGSVTAAKDSKNKPVCVGPIFKKFAVVIKVYATFRTAYPEVVRDIDVPPQALSQLQSGSVNDLVFGTSMGKSMIKRLVPARQDGTEGMTRDRVLKQFLERLASDKQRFAKHLGTDPDKWKQETFLGLIRAPTERIQAYKRFLSALLINTPDMDPPHPDASDLRSSLKLLSDADTQITQAGKLKQIYKELKSIEAILFNTPKKFHVGDSPSRRLIKQGYLVKRCRREDKIFYFWLFNDSLVYAHDRSGGASGTFLYNRHFQVSEIGFQDRPDGIDQIGVNQSVLAGMALSRTSTPGDPKFAFTILRERPHKSIDLMVPNVIYPTLEDKDFSEAERRQATVEEKRRIKEEWMKAFMGCDLGIKQEDMEFDVAPSWQSDKLTTKCTQCETKFTFLNRRHHCRRCGKIFCGKCSSHTVKLQKKSNEAEYKPKRVCDKCYDEVLRLQELVEQEDDALLDDDDD